MSVSVTGHVWLDADQDGNDDGGAGEPGIPGVDVVISQGGVDLLATTTDMDGDYIILVGALDDGDYQVTASKADYTETSTNPVTVTLVTGPGSETANFGLVVETMTSFRPTSPSEICKISWVAGAGVQVTTRGKRNHPAFTRLYPNTTYSDYLKVVMLASLGRQAVRLALAGRPSILAPLDI